MTTPNRQSTDADPKAPGRERVLDLLRRQRDLHRELQRMAGRQHRLVNSDDPAALLPLLQDRRTVTDSLLEVGRELAPVRKNWPVVRRSLNSADQREADRIIAEVNGLLGRIIAEDDKDARLLAARKANVASKLTALRADRQALNAYAATTSSNAGSARPTRLDQTSEGL